MGWETLAIVGFSALSGVVGMNQANSQAKGIARQGEIAAQDSANATIRSTGKLTTSFLNSGLTLEGGPMDVLKQAFRGGYTDIERIRSNANASAKNVVSSARTKAIQGLATSFAGASAASSIFSGVGDFATDVGNGFGSVANGTSFDLGYGASQSFRAAGGGFAPGEFV